MIHLCVNAFRTYGGTGNVSLDDEYVRMKSTEDDKNVLQPSVADEMSADEQQSQLYNSYVSDTPANCFDSFLFWRVVPLAVDQSAVNAACGDIGITSSMNKLSLNVATLTESVPQMQSAILKGTSAGAMVVLRRFSIVVGNTIM
jgi:hypothetical protein